MSTNLFFSIIIPAYNLSNVLISTLESVASQNFNQDLFEVVITDDQSTDDTFELTEKYKNIKNIKILRNDVNSGPGIARNRSIENSSGEYLIFLDGDDFLVPNTLLSLFNFLEKNYVDLVTFNWAYSSNPKSSQNSYLKLNIPESKEERLKFFLAGNLDGSVIYSVIRREIIVKNKIEFPTGFHEDISFLCWMYFYSNSFAILDKILYLKNDRDGSIVNSFSEKHLYGFLRSWPLILNTLSQRDIDFDAGHFLQSYLRGINGMVVGGLRRVKSLGDKKTRMFFYEKIAQILMMDNFLNLHDLDKFPNITKKDKIANYFLNTYFNVEFDMNVKLEKIDTFVLENL